MNPNGINPDAMNPEIERQLKITVERAVRPLKTWDNRKYEIRRELLGHLTAIYQEELTRCGDEHAALSVARSRFGATEELTQELQRGVPRIPRWAAWLNEVFRIDVAISPRQNAWRWTMFWFCELFFLFGACDLVVILKGMNPWPMIVTLLTPLVMLTLIAYVVLEGTFGAILNGSEDRIYWRIIRCTCYKLGALGFIYKLLLSSQMIPLWERFGAREALLVVLSTVMLPVVFLIVMWAGRKEFSSQVEWARLDLSEE
ncbi:MAG: hypothetical protein U0903_06920 [Planctomycetales bacterium]